MRVLRATRASIAAAAIAAATFATASSVTAALTLGALTLGAAPAYAGPDDGRSVETRAHIDAPKVFWNKQAGTFAINSQANGKTVPLATTANWVGRGYNDDGSQNYTFPITSDPRLDFLGKDGQLLYMAPQVPGPGNSPIWSGFGADTAVPIEQFQDGNFALEMVGFNGPGQMNMFNYSTYGSLPVTRLFSSHDKVSRTVWLDPGTHTHNITTFTKPGRYEVTFDATARTTDGNFITSKPTTLVWRVGGTNPADEKLGDVRAAYSKAAAADGGAVEGAAAEGTAAEGGEASKPTFTIAPHAGSERDGDKNLTDLTFNAGSKDAEGTVVFYIDGYHLAEVPVKNGTATWSEMIGSQPSNFQAVFVPTKGAARWISAPLSATTGQKSVSTQEAGQFPEEAPDAPAGEFSKGEVTVGSRDVSVTARPQDKSDLINIDTKPADDSLIYNVTGGFYEEGYDEPTCPVEGVSGPGRRTIVADSEYCKGEGYSLRLTLEPQPRAAIGNTDVIDLGHVSGAGKTVEARFAGIGGSDAPEPDQPGPSEPEPNPGDDGSDGSDGALLDTPVTINNGHVDLRAMEVGGKFSVALGDDSRQHAKESVLRTINSTTLEVTKLAKVKREGNVLADESYDVLAPKGSELYVLPQGQQPGRVWPGFSSEALDRVKYPEGATMTLTPVSAPEGGKWFAYTENLGAINRMYASSEKASDVPLPPGTHMHTAWAFTKPGTYTIDVTARAKQSSSGERSAAAKNDGEEATAETQRLTFVVEKKSATDEPGASEAPSENPTAEPTEEPTEDPSEEPTEQPSGEPSQQPTAEPSAESPEAPSAEPTQEPGAQPSTEHPSESAGSSAQPGEAGDRAGAGSASDAGSDLARTGAAVLAAGVIAGLAVAAGVVLLLVARRRKG